jgi:hypothetical protein
MPISAISQQREAYCSYKSKNRFPAGNPGKLSARNVNGLSAVSSCSRSPLDMDKPHLVAFSRKTGFLLFKERVCFNFKIYISAVQC